MDYVSLCERGVTCSSLGLDKGPGTAKVYVRASPVRIIARVQFFCGTKKASGTGSVLHWKTFLFFSFFMLIQADFVNAEHNSR